MKIFDMALKVEERLHHKTYEATSGHYNEALFELSETELVEVIRLAHRECQCTVEELRARGALVLPLYFKLRKC